MASCARWAVHGKLTPDIHPQESVGLAMCKQHVKYLENAQDTKLAGWSGRAP
jgi:hypothetical protein